MKTTKNIIYLMASAWMLLSAQYAFGQEIIVPYQMGFEEEDATEMAFWVLNPGLVDPEPGMDRWIVGSSTHNGGRYSLYVSCNGEDAEFGAKPNVQYAYRDFTIPTGQYDVTFDYRCMGVIGSAMCAGVSFASAISKDMVSKIGSNTLPKSIQSASLVKDIRGSIQWKNTSFRFNAKEGVTYRIFFAWYNNNKDTTLVNPVGGCVDNIQITSAACSKPHDMEAESKNDSVFVTWQGTSEEYIFERRRRGTERWYMNTGLTDKGIILEGLGEGVYDFRVRGICNDVDTSAYAYLNSFIVYYPEQHCIDYIHLHNSNIHGTIGTWTSSKKDPYAVPDTIVDYGPDNKASRHTVNTEPDIYDPRTGGRLLTIPEDEFASVRLGNWAVSSQAESLSFDFTADSADNALVLIKYAVVLEDPDHGYADQPRFTLEILDEYGNLIDPTCGAADFYADHTREGWHTEGTGSSKVSWKDWTTLGLNLMEMGLAGQQITIRFTTYDCTMGGHYGYAYFTLACASAKINGISCGDDPVMTVEAPNGFNYQWFDKNDNLVATTKQLSVLPSDTTTYRCHLSYKENAECGFDLYSASKPRFPVAEFEYQWAPTDCQNKVRFTNKSHVMVKFDDYEKHDYNDKCDDLQWDFGGGMYSPDERPVITFPNEGGVFPVTLSASIAEGRCTDDTTIYIKIPAIGDVIYEKDSAICQGDYVLWGDARSDSVYYAAEAGDYAVTWKSVAGCDSIWILHLSINPTSTRQTSDTTICAENPLIVDGQIYKYTTSGKFYRFYKNQFNCDSTIWCYVTVLDSIKPDVQMKDIEGAVKYSGEFRVRGTGFDRYTITHEGKTDSYTLKDTLLTGLNGGLFEFHFFNALNCDVEVTKYMTPPCAELIFQRWNDVLSVYHPDSIGGQHFKSFQWTKNDEDIPDATDSYYYDINGLDMSAVYAVRVVTDKDSTYTSCSVQPVPYEEPQVPARKVINNQHLTIIVNGTYYDALGQQIRKEDE